MGLLKSSHARKKNEMTPLQYWLYYVCDNRHRINKYKNTIGFVCKYILFVVLRFRRISRSGVPTSLGRKCLFFALFPNPYGARLLLCFEFFIDIFQLGVNSFFKKWNSYIVVYLTISQDYEPWRKPLNLSRLFWRNF